MLWALRQQICGNISRLLDGSGLLVFVTGRKGVKAAVQGCWYCFWPFDLGRIQEELR